MMTRKLIRNFSLAFGRPVNEAWTDLTVSERELLGKLLFEETVEYVTKGLGLEIHCLNMVAYDESQFKLQLREGAKLDPIECVDGLADVNVVAHFCAHWHGFNLDLATEVVNDSNMSKLDNNGQPIINECRFTSPCVDHIDHECELIDPTRPVGKILKSVNFKEPNLQPVIDYGNK